MPSKAMIEDAERNVQKYLSEYLIEKNTNIDKLAINILINNSKESIKVAELLLNDEISNLWTIVTSYYSMYYIAKAALCKKGYKIGTKISHKVTADALIVYIRKDLKESLIEDYENARIVALEIAGLKADEILESFEFERKKRSAVQYNMTSVLIHSKAKTSFERAKIFVNEMEKLIDKK